MFVPREDREVSARPSAPPHPATAAKERYRRVTPIHLHTTNVLSGWIIDRSAGGVKLKERGSQTTRKLPAHLYTLVIKPNVFSCPAGTLMIRRKGRLELCWRHSRVTGSRAQ